MTINTENSRVEICKVSPKGTGLYLKQQREGWGGVGEYVVKEAKLWQPGRGGHQGQ